MAVVLPEAGDNRWDALIKGMKQSCQKQPYPSDYL